MTEPFVTIAAFDVHSDAMTAKALLESAGIMVLVRDAETTSLNLLWAGWTGGIKLDVPASQHEKAQQLIQEVRKSNRRLQVVGEDVPLTSTCLSCGADLGDEALSCPQCGWSFEGEDYSEYDNGPVPHSLLGVAYSPVDSKSFALPAAAVPAYVAWCTKEGLRILSWEVWLRSPLTHRVVEASVPGSAQSLLAAVPEAVTQHGDAVLFCIRTAPTETAEDGGA